MSDTKTLIDAHFSFEWHGEIFDNREPYKPQEDAARKTVWFKSVDPKPLGYIQGLRNGCYLTGGKNIVGNVTLQGLYFFKGSNAKDIMHLIILLNNPYLPKEVISGTTINFGNLFTLNPNVTRVHPPQNHDDDAKRFIDDDNHPEPAEDMVLNKSWLDSLPQAHAPWKYYPDWCRNYMPYYASIMLPDAYQGDGYPKLLEWLKNNRSFDVTITGMDFRHVDSDVINIRGRKGMADPLEKIWMPSGLI